jgi:hypothetical protein
MGLALSQSTSFEGDFENLEKIEIGRLSNDSHISVTDVLRTSAGKR